MSLKHSKIWIYLILLTGAIIANPTQKIHSLLIAQLGGYTTGETIPVYIKFANRLSLTDVQSRTQGLSRKVRRSEVVALLKSHARQTQQRVHAFLQAQGSDKVSDLEDIWAINVLAFKTTPDVIFALADQFPEVVEIRYNPVIDAESAKDDEGIARFNRETGTSVAPLYAPQPGLTLINAPQVWAEGDSGQGVVVSNVDTGTDWQHPDIVRNVWNNLGEDADGDGQTLEFNGSSWVLDTGDLNGIDDDGNGFTDDLIGWDFGSNDNNPQDSDGHGTQAGGLVVGDGTNGTETGVVPRAKLMILRIAGAPVTGWWAAYQYAFENGADVTTSSFSLKWNSQPDYAAFRAMNDMELAAGVVHTNSIGNQGNQGTPGCNNSYPIPYNISAPGNSPSPWIHPDQWSLVGGISSVIGCGNVDANTDVISSSSGYGPAAWENIQARCPNYPNSNPLDYQDYPYNLSGTVEPDSIGLLKPDVAAPGTNTISTTIGGGYGTFGGTSAATPHMAGVVALLLSVNPQLEPEDISRILQTTALEKGDPGKDPRYGAGRVDAYAAYLQAKSERGAPADITDFTAYSDYRTPDRMLLQWTNPTHLLNGDTLTADQFALFLLRDGQLIDSISGEFNSYFDSSLVDGQLYTYQLYAKTHNTGSTSNFVEATWIAGGSPIPSSATMFNVGGNESEVVISWLAPSKNIDGTPMDDYAGIRIYQNGVAVSDVVRTTADTAKTDTVLYQPASSGFYDWQISIIDNETPQNESELTTAIGTPLNFPIFDEFFINGAPNPALWINSNTEVNDRSINPPSGNFALNLNGSPTGEDVVDTKPIDLSVANPSDGFVIEYYYQPQGSGNAPESSDSLRVYFTNSLNEWLLVRAYPGTTLQPFKKEVIYLDSLDAGNGSFYHSQFQMRFRTTGGAGPFPNDDWFIDNVIIGSQLINSIDGVEEVQPATFALHGNYPNPFNPSTSIRFDIPAASEVKLIIYNSLGQEVRELENRTLSAGTYNSKWDGKDAKGSTVASGIYFYKLQVRTIGGQQFYKTQKMILMK
jgi:subtilisin family serine protease